MLSVMLSALVLALALTQAPPRPPNVPAAVEVDPRWYGDTLLAMRELPLLTSTPANAVAYRLTVIPAWGPRVLVRLVISEGTAIVVGKRANGPGAFGAQALSEDTTKTLSPEELAVFDTRVSGLQLADLVPSENAGGREGSTWVLEVVAHGQRHLAFRWSPTFRSDARGLSAFREVCEHLYRLSALRGDVTNRGTVELAKTPPAPFKTQ